MDGIIFEQDKDSLATVCIVESLSDELKNQIRLNLTSICQGVSRGESGSAVFSFKHTLKEFLVRYNEKEVAHKKGIIGELLAHVIFINYFDYFRTVSPLFNLEDRNIKKAFDVILYHSTTKELFYAEVKSGEAEHKTANDKNIQLLGKALADIRDKFDVPNDNNWMNALNGAIVALGKNNIKKEVEKILESCLSASQSSACSSADKNAILISVTYDNSDEKVKLIRVDAYSKKVKNRKLLKNIMCLSIQKGTYDKVAEFLTQESANA